MAYRQPGEASPSFAQTGAELDLDASDSDEDLFNLDDYDQDQDDEEAVDLQSEVGGAEAYELRGMRGSLSPGPGPRPGSSRSATSRKMQRRRRGGLGRRRGSTSTAASYKLYTPDEDAAVRRKFDRKLVLFVSLLFLLSFVDRSSALFILIILRN